MPTGTTEDIGAIKIRDNDGVKVRFVKVRNGGPIAGRWIRLARWTWEQVNGPVPPGKRVVHIDGNTLNDNLENYTLMTPGEVIKHYHRLRPKMSQRNRRGDKRLNAVRQFNRESAAVKRALGWLPNYWYAVDHQLRIIHNTPFRSRRLLYLSRGVDIGKNGRRKLPASAIAAVRGSELSDERYRQYKKQGNAPCVKSESEICRRIPS